MDDSLRITHEYKYETADALCSSEYILPVLRDILGREAPPPAEIFEVGCGNGSTADMLSRMGYKVTAIDPSASGIKIGRETYPQIHFDQSSGYDDLQAKYGTFPVVISLEVIEHLYDPRAYLHVLRGLLSKNSSELSKCLITGI